MADNLPRNDRQSSAAGAASPPAASSTESKAPAAASKSPAAAVPKATRKPPAAARAAAPAATEKPATGAPGNTAPPKATAPARPAAPPDASAPTNGTGANGSPKEPDAARGASATDQSAQTSPAAAAVANDTAAPKSPAPPVASGGGDKPASAAKATPPKKSAAAPRPLPKAVAQGDQRCSAALAFDDDRPDDSALREWLRTAPSWLTSMVVHVVVLLILAILTVREPDAGAQPDLTAMNNNRSEEKPLDQPPEEIEFKPQDVKDLEAFTEAVVSDRPIVAEEVVPLAPAEDLSAAELQISTDPLAMLSDQSMLQSLLDRAGVIGGSDLSGRGAANKAALLARYGGTPQSEAAVAMALDWLARHQLPDGSWSFDHRAGECNGRCKDHGELDQARNGATGLALMAFLGAGMTHKEGKYKQNVYRGLRYLTMKMGRDGSLHESGGSMYSHGIASIALCEAYAMSQDKELRPYAQGAINFIVYAQDPVGGGWRYQPRQRGDTSVVGWQVMALKSGHMGYLAIPKQTIDGATRFLDFVQSNGGANYGYTDPGTGQARTAVGLLCRMYLGWKKSHPPLIQGVNYLSRSGPSRNDMYYNYYATQVLHHWGGQEWTQWNNVMREMLVSTQAKEGHEKGSWFFNGGHAGRGGRHFCTCMAAMTLEVYYRHLPIYREQAAQDDFDD
jgi:hypothetical protein